MRHDFRPALCALLLSAISATGASAQTSAGSKAAAKPEDPEEFSRVRGLFDVDLPKTVEKYKLKVFTHPHFGDLIHRDYLRVPVGVRVGVSERTELSAELESYFTHGLKGHGPGNGLDSLRLGSKHQFRDWLREDNIDVSAGVNVAFPLGRPPLDLTDGHYHASPYVTFSKRLIDHPKLTPFVSVGTDLLWKSSVPGSFAKNQPHSDSMGLSAGYFYDYSRQFKYTLVTSYWTTSLIGSGNKQFFSINPSVLWELPPALTFHSKGHWIFGIGVKADFGPDGTDFGSSAKLRGEFKFTRFFKSARN
jgi:hypothetical protein